MPGLYSWTGSNANVASTNTIGLYGLTSNSSILSSATVLLGLLSQNGNVNFALDPAYSNTKVLAYTANIGVTSGTYGNIDYFPVITVTGDGRVTSVSTISIASATGLYGNANVAAYLPTYTGSLDNSSSIVSLWSNAATQQSQIIVLTSNAATQADQIAAIAGNLSAFETYANIHFGTSSYSDANVAAYLPTYTGNLEQSSSIINLWSNAASQQTQIDGLTSNAATQAAQINAISGNLNAFEIYANATFGTSSYSNVDVAAYMPTYTGTLDNSSTIVNLWSNAATQAAQITAVAGNLSAFETYANATFGTSNYGNSNVAAYLPTYTGTFGTLSSLTSAGNVTVNTGGYFVGDGRYLTNVDALTAITLRIQVKNTSGGVLTKGTPVYATGTVGVTDVYEVSASRADTSGTMPAIGLLEQTLNNNDTGTATQIGLLSSINTNSYTANQVLYIGITGGLTATRPNDGYLVQPIGSVGRVNSSTGSIFVNIWNTLQVPNLGQGNVWVGPTGGGLPVEQAMYGNTQVAAYLPINTSNVAGSYFVGDGRYLTNVSSTSFGNANVAAYLPTYTGSLENSSSVVNLWANAAVQQVLIDSLTSGGNVFVLGNTTTPTQIYGNTLLTKITYQANTYVSAPVVSGSKPYVTVIEQSLPDTYGVSPTGGDGLFNVTAYGTGSVSPESGAAHHTGIITLTADGQYASQPAVLTLTGGSDVASITLTANVINNYGNVYSSNYFVGNGRYLTGVTASSIDGIAAGGSLTGTYPNPTIAASGVTAGTYGNASYYATFTIGSDGRITSASNVAVSSAYGNTQVAAYLPTYSGSLGGTLTTAAQPNITSLDGVGSIATGNAQILVTPSTATVGIRGGTATTSAGTLSLVSYSSSTTNGNVYLAAYDTSNNVGGQIKLASGIELTGTTTIYGTTTVSGANVNVTAGAGGGYVNAVEVRSTNGFFWSNGTPYGGGSSYGNTQVAAFLPTYTGTIGDGSGQMTLYGSASRLAGTGLNYVEASASGVDIYSATDVVVNSGLGIVANANIKITSGYFVGDGTYLTNMYGNTQANALLTSGTVSAKFANVSSANGFFWSNGTPFSGSYGNTQVAEYLPTYTGNIGAVVTASSQPYIKTMAYLTSFSASATAYFGNSSQTGGYIYVSPSPTTLTDNLAGLSVSVGRTQINNPLRVINGNVNIDYVAGNAGSHLIVANTATAQSFISTNGFFWANGTAYSTGGGSTYGNSNVAAYLPTYSGNIGGTITTASQPYITAVGTLGSLTATGNITTTTGYFVGDGSYLTNLPSGGGYGNTQVAAYLPTYTGNLAASNFTANVNYNNTYITSAILSTTREKTANIGVIQGTVTVDASTGPIQLATVTANITINTNNITNLGVGQTITLVLTQNTNANLRILTSNIKYAGGYKTLSTANAAIDTITVTYDGEKYLASLVKGYA